MKKALLPVAAFIALVLLPPMASAQSYPYYPYRAWSGNQTDFAVPRTIRCAIV